MRKLEVLGGAALVLATFVGGMGLAAAADHAGKCQVTVDRSGNPDSFNVTRGQLDNGDCVCRVTTGPETQSANVERMVARIERKGDCSDDKAGEPIVQSDRISGAAAGGGAAALGLVALLATHHGSDSTGG